GRPVVGAAVGGLLDSVVDGRTGLLVPPRDAHALAAALQRLADDPALAERLGSAARVRAEPLHGWSTVAARTARSAERVGAPHRRVVRAGRGRAPRPGARRPRARPAGRHRARAAAGGERTVTRPGSDDGRAPGAPRDAARHWLAAHAPDLHDGLDLLVAEAAR